MPYLKYSVQDMVDFVRREIVDEDTTNPRWSDQKIVDTFNQNALEITMEYLCIEGTISLTSPTLSGVKHTETDFKIALPDEFLKMQDFPWYYNGVNWYEIDDEIKDKADMIDEILETGQTGQIPDSFYLSDAYDYLWIYPAAPSGSTIRVYANLKPTLLTITGMSSTYSDLPVPFHQLLCLMTAHTIASRDKQSDKVAPAIAARWQHQKDIIDSFWRVKVDKSWIIQPYQR